MIDRRKISRMVRLYRSRMGISQLDLAKKADLGSATIKRIETGKSGSYESLRAIADVFGIDVADLLDAEPAGYAEVQPLIDEWVAGERLRPRLSPTVTEEEIEWLRSLPPVFWVEFAPEEETLEYLVRARRVAKMS